MLSPPPWEFADISASMHRWLWSTTIASSPKRPLCAQLVERQHHLPHLVGLQRSSSEAVPLIQGFLSKELNSPLNSLSSERNYTCQVCRGPFANGSWMWYVGPQQGREVANCSLFFVCVQLQQQRVLPLRFVTYGARVQRRE